MSDSVRADARARVLLVDDEPHVIRGIQSVLHDRPYELLGATSARAALEMLRAERIDVVVADERMPDVTGTELLCVVAREFPAAGRIVLTGQATVEAAVRAINQARVVRFLLKPCRPHVLCAAIDAALEARGAGATVSTTWGASRLGSTRSGRRSGCHTGLELGGSRGVRLAEGESDTTRINGDEAAPDPVPAALNAADLLLYAQKIVRLDRAAVPCGYEILSWVRAKNGGVLTLAEFASTGEHPRRSPSIDRQIVHRALRALRPHREVLRRLGITVSLTLSGESITDADFVRFLCAEVSSSDVGRSLMVQISAHGIAVDRHSVADLLRAVCRTGCRVEIDDIHAAPVALSALEGLPVARIKIARIVSDDIVTNRPAGAVIRAIVEHAQRANIETAASFVATSAAARELRALGVDYGQGYAFGAPEPLETALGNLKWPDH